MRQTISTHHPAVNAHLRSLLVIACIAIVSLTIAVVLLATDDGDSVPAAPAAAAVSSATPVSSTRYDGGPEEGTRGPVVLSTTRFDGGPEEGTRGPGR